MVTTTYSEEQQMWAPIQTLKVMSCVDPIKLVDLSDSFPITLWDCWENKTSRHSEKHLAPHIAALDAFIHLTHIF